MLKSKRTRYLGPKLAQAMTPIQVAKAYNYPLHVDCTHRKVCILELGGGYKASDVYSYCDRYGIKHPVLINEFVDGATIQSDPQGADGEVCLDIDVIAAIAQGCKIIVVFAPNSDQGFIDGLAKCVALNPDAISISWGSEESSWSQQTRDAVDLLMKEAAEKGIPTFVAAGDNGSSDGGSGDNVDYPSSSPWSIACGGTHLELKSDDSRLSETVWSSSFWSSGATGGGVSTFYPLPDWQQKSVKLKTGRNTPDVSGNADPSTGYEIDIDGQSATVGGTSAVAPLYAALQLLINAAMDKHVGNLHTRLYQLETKCFYDVTQGSNGSYSSGPGYDNCTGLGVLDGTEWLNYLKTL